ncbi:MAG: hypothetical protein QM680_13645 [Luteolibacter sp.]
MIRLRGRNGRIRELLLQGHEIDGLLLVDRAEACHFLFELRHMRFHLGCEFRRFQQFFGRRYLLFRKPSRFCHHRPHHLLGFLHGGFDPRDPFTRPRLDLGRLIGRIRRRSHLPGH